MGKDYIQDSIEWGWILILGEGRKLKNGLFLQTRYVKE